MSLQDAITNLNDQIDHELQAATTLEQQIADEQRTSNQKVDGWRQQADRHQAAAQRMKQDVDAKQKQLARELKAAAERERKADALKDAGERIVDTLL